MERYDPLRAPDAEAWLDLDEGERQLLVELYHEQKRERLPNLTLHAMIHVVVENQLASGEPAEVRGVLERLRREGLDRHEAVHAIGSVLAEHLHGLLAGGVGEAESTSAYSAALLQLTAEKWRAS